TEPIALLLTDLMMPDMDGRKLAGAVRTLRPPIATLYMSGYSEEDPQALMTDDSRAAFLPKPFTRETLLRHVRDLLDQDAALTPPGASGTTAP
ncbi:MAG: response regulator, partial [Longimicrobiales bacterium]